jgi:hypothetical protein
MWTEDYPDYDFPTKTNVLNANKGFMPVYFKFVRLYQKSHGTKSGEISNRSAAQSNSRWLTIPKAYDRTFSKSGILPPMDKYGQARA